MVNTVWVNADHGHDFHPLADHMTKLDNFIKEENQDCSAFRFSLQLMLEQALTILIVYLNRKSGSTVFYLTLTPVQQRTTKNTI